MKIRVDAKELRDMLAEMLPFARKPKADDPGQPATFSTMQASVIIRTGDYHKNHYCERTVEAMIDEGGEVGFDINTCLSSLGVVDGEVILEVEQGMAGSIITGNTNLAFRGSAEKIWKPEVPADGWKTIETTGPLVEAAKIANKCRRQDDDIRYAINSLCFYTGERGLELVGTDGILLVSARTGIDSGLEGMVIAQPSIAAALASFKNSDPASIHVGESAIWVRQVGKVNVVNRITGAFPDYNKYVDKNAQPIGILEPEDIKKLQVAISKKVLQPTAQGLLHVHAVEDELWVQGKYKQRVLTVGLRGGVLPPSAVAADQFGRALSLFRDDIEIYHAPKAGSAGHLYLTDQDVFVMLSLKKDFFK